MPTEPTITIARDSAGRELSCYLEQRLQIDGADYGLLTPVDVPVILALVADDGSVHEVDDPCSAEPILCAADAELQKCDLALIRSEGILTVRGELGEADEPGEADETDDQAGDFELLISFDANGQRYGLYIPLDPPIMIARLHGEAAMLLEGEEFERFRPRVEQMLADLAPHPVPMTHPVPLNADTLSGGTLHVTVRATPTFRARLWLATGLMRLAARLVGLELRVEHRPLDSPRPSA